MQVPTVERSRTSVTLLILHLNQIYDQLLFHVCGVNPGLLLIGVFLLKVSDDSLNTRKTFGDLEVRKFPQSHNLNLNLLYISKY